ncbi:MAG TPA: efflux RND transporter periplasmic adaptor subunit [Methylomirabilota bacterium]|nr:efflux RND transporter periplasmic adaptor subunit [Methylomirabilota bacterium]
MKLKIFSIALLIAVVAIFAVSCGKKQSNGKPDNVDYYTCTMHPSVRSQNPNDKCPICGMDLVPVYKKGATTNAPSNEANQPPKNSGMAGMENMQGMTMTTNMNAEKPGEFNVPVERQQQIGVTFATVEKQPVKFSIRAVGMVAGDKQRHWDYVARVDGYVQKLFVFSRGEVVEKNAPLLSIYSPDFLTTENEFLDLLRIRDEMTNNAALTESNTRLIASAKERLRLWNIGEEQIAELEKTRKPVENITLVSPFRGIVQDLDVDQGRHVSVGDHLVDVADLSVVWVWAQFYQDELPLLKKDLPVTITASSMPGEKFEGKISVIDPFVNDASRTVRVRIDVENPDFKLLPDMYVDATLNIDSGESLAVPVNAVLPTGQHNIVFVDKGEGKLEPRFIELGRQFADYYEVKSGLKENERVVASANFLIDAESQVQGALKSW